MFSLANYPHGAPGFIADHPAPVEWQNRVRAIDPDLAVAWNPHHRAGPCWAIMRYHGQVQNGVVLLSRGNAGTWSTLFKAMASGWSYLKPLLDPADRPIGLDESYAEVLLGELRESDMRRKFGTDSDEALLKIQREEVKGKMQRDDVHDTLMHEAFEDKMAGRPSEPASLILPGGSS